MKKFGVLANRSANSVLGSASAWDKHRDGVTPKLYDTYEEAKAEADRRNGSYGFAKNVWYSACLHSNHN